MIAKRFILCLISSLALMFILGGCREGGVDMPQTNVLPDGTLAEIHYSVHGGSVHGTDYDAEFKAGMLISASYWELTDDSLDFRELSNVPLTDEEWNTVREKALELHSQLPPTRKVEEKKSFWEKLFRRREDSLIMLDGCASETITFVIDTDQGRILLSYGLPSGSFTDDFVDTVRTLVAEKSQNSNSRTAAFAAATPFHNSLR